MNHVAAGKRTILVLRGCAVAAFLGAIMLLVPSTIRLASRDWQDWHRWDVMLRTIAPVGYIGLLAGLVAFAYALVARQQRAPRIISAVALSALFIVLFIVVLGQVHEAAWQQWLADRATLARDVRLYGDAALADYETSPNAVTGLVMALIGIIPGGVLLLWRCRKMARERPEGGADAPAPRPRMGPGQ